MHDGLASTPRHARLHAITASVFALAISARGCGGNTMTVFPAGLEPLEATNMAPLPTATATEQYPETLNDVIGTTPDYGWVHARGYVHASLNDTWAAMRVPDVDVDRRKVQMWMTTQNVDPTYRYSYLIHNISTHGITVTFDVSWRQDVSTTNPNAVAARFQKVAGTDFISLLAGSVVVTSINGNVTEVDFIEHLTATGSGPDVAQSTIRDLYASIVAQVHGRPLPTY